jgi:CRP-like cAMP-binding protein
VFEPSFAQLAARCPAFAPLDAPVLERWASAARRTGFGRGRVIFVEGDPSDAVYLIVRGIVRIVRTELDGTETTLRLVRNGDVFGELAVLDGGPRSATAIAVRDVVAYRLPASAVLAELPAPGTVARTMLGWLVREARYDTERLVTERTDRLPCALARLVLDDPGLLDRVNQGELASLLGVSRQSLNQTLRAWEREGLVRRAAPGSHVVETSELCRRYLDAGVTAPFGPCNVPTGYTAVDPGNRYVDAAT